MYKTQSLSNGSEASLWGIPLRSTRDLSQINSQETQLQQSFSSTRKSNVSIRQLPLDFSQNHYPNEEIDTIATTATTEGQDRVPSSRGFSINKVFGESGIVYEENTHQQDFHFKVPPRIPHDSETIPRKAFGESGRTGSTAQENPVHKGNHRQMSLAQIIMATAGNSGTTAKGLVQSGDTQYRHAADSNRVHLSARLMKNYWETLSTSESPRTAGENSKQTSFDDASKQNTRTSSLSSGLAGKGSIVTSSQNCPVSSQKTTEGSRPSFVFLKSVQDNYKKQIEEVPGIKTKPSHASVQDELSLKTEEEIPKVQRKVTGTEENVVKTLIDRRKPDGDVTPSPAVNGTVRPVVQLEKRLTSEERAGPSICSNLIKLNDVNSRKAPTIMVEDPTLSVEARGSGVKKQNMTNQREPQKTVISLDWKQKESRCAQMRKEEFPKVSEKPASNRRENGTQANGDEVEHATLPSVKSIVELYDKETYRVVPERNKVSEIKNTRYREAGTVTTHFDEESGDQTDASALVRKNKSVQTDFETSTSTNRNPPKETIPVTIRSPSLLKKPLEVVFSTERTKQGGIAQTESIQNDKGYGHINNRKNFSKSEYDDDDEEEIIEELASFKKKPRSSGTTSVQTNSGLLLRGSLKTKWFVEKGMKNHLKAKPTVEANNENRVPVSIILPAELSILQLQELVKIAFIDRNLADVLFADPARNHVVPYCADRVRDIREDISDGDPKKKSRVRFAKDNMTTVFDYNAEELNFDGENTDI